MTHIPGLSTNNSLASMLDSDQTSSALPSLDLTLAFLQLYAICYLRFWWLCKVTQRLLAQQHTVWRETWF